MALENKQLGFERAPKLERREVKPLGVYTAKLHGRDVTVLMLENGKAMVQMAPAEMAFDFAAQPAKDSAGFLKTLRDNRFGQVMALLGGAFAVAGLSSCGSDAGNSDFSGANGPSAKAPSNTRTVQMALSTDQVDGAVEADVQTPAWEDADSSYKSIAIEELPYPPFGVDDTKKVLILSRDNGQGDATVVEYVTCDAIENCFNAGIGDFQELPIDFGDLTIDTENLDVNHKGTLYSGSGALNTSTIGFNDLGELEVSAPAQIFPPVSVNDINYIEGNQMIVEDGGTFTYDTQTGEKVLVQNVSGYCGAAEKVYDGADSFWIGTRYESIPASCKLIQAPTLAELHAGAAEIMGINNIVALGNFLEEPRVFKDLLIFRVLDENNNYKMRYIAFVPEVLCDNNGTCEGNEDIDNCPADCTPLPECGDGTCNGAETQETCPQECDGVCGDGVCHEINEDINNCIVDCGSCGDGVCEAGEFCPEDCDPVPICGDDVCDPEEEGVCLDDCPVVEPDAGMDADTSDPDTGDTGTEDTGPEDTGVDPDVPDTDPADTDAPDTSDGGGSDAGDATEPLDGGDTSTDTSDTSELDTEPDVEPDVPDVLPTNGIAVTEQECRDLLDAGIVELVSMNTAEEKCELSDCVPPALGTLKGECTVMVKVHAEKAPLKLTVGDPNGNGGAFKMERSVSDGNIAAKGYQLEGLYRIIQTEHLNNGEPQILIHIEVNGQVMVVGPVGTDFQFVKTIVERMVDGKMMSVAEYRGTVNKGPNGEESIVRMALYNADGSEIGTRFFAEGEEIVFDSLEPSKLFDNLTTSPDAGVDTGVEHDAGGGDLTSTPTDPEGCSCSVPGGKKSPVGLAIPAMLAIGAVFARRRREKQESK